MQSKPVLGELEKKFQYLVEKKTNFDLIAVCIANRFTLQKISHFQGHEEDLHNISEHLKLFFNSEILVHQGKIFIFIENIFKSPLDMTQIINEIRYILTNPKSLSHPQNICPLVSCFYASIPKECDNLEDYIEKMDIVFEKTAYCREKFFFNFSEAKTLLEEESHKISKAKKLKYHIKNDLISLAFQDIISRKKGKVSHYECLLRLIKENGEFESVGPYISVAEEYEFIDSIDSAVLNLVAKEIKSNPNIELSFNISGFGIYNSDWLQEAKFLFKDRQIANRIIVEITETSVKKDLGKAAIFVASLQELGCRVALDDFGSGYTSFRQAKTLPVDYVKIDGAFVKDVANNPENFLFVKLVLEMSHGLGCKAIAEYVETKEAAEILIDLGIDYMQGNYFSPAVNHRPWK